MKQSPDTIDSPILRAGAAMETWRIESDRGATAATAWIVMLAGVVIMLLVWRGFDGSTGAAAGLFLGLLLVVVGLGGVLLRNHRVIVVDPKTRSLLIEDRSRLGTRRLRLLFSEITGIEVGSLGDEDGGSISYDLVISRHDGRPVWLFAGAYFAGRHRHATMEHRRRRLLEYLGRQDSRSAA